MSVRNEIAGDKEIGDTVLAVASAAAPTYEEGKLAPLSVTLDGQLRTSGSGGGGGSGDASAANQTSQITQETAINTVLGTKADPKASTSDVTPISAMSIWKQISFSIQAAAASLATLASSVVGLGQADADHSQPVVHANNRQNSVAFPIAMTTDTSIYGSGDLIADTQQMDAFFNRADGCGVINSITIIDKDAQGAALYVIFHSTATSMGSENSAPTISDANALGIQGVVAVATTDYITVSGTKVACIRNIGLPVKAVAGTDDLYVSILNATGTPTFTATGLNLLVGGLLD